MIYAGDFDIAMIAQGVPCLPAVEAMVRYPIPSFVSLVFGSRVVVRSLG